MILKRFYDEPLAHASYLVGCPGAGEAIVIDPNRDLNQYIEAAAADGMRIVAVTETHIHADYASGSLELAERTGATLYLSNEGGPDWQYAFADRPFVKSVSDGSEIRIGRIRVDVVHTPGHTPEHISFVLTDEASSDITCCAFTGDFLFVGDVGRPDLLERAAGIEGTMEKGAHVLYQSIQKFKKYPSSMMVWPAHGAGSPCGKSLGGVPASTLGYELSANWALKAKDEDQFVADVLAGQPDPPVYYKEMKRLNKTGAAEVGSLGAPTRKGGNHFLTALAKGETVLDVRSLQEASASMVPGATLVPMGKGFTIWAGWLTPYNAPIHILASNEEDAARAKRNLATIGLDNVVDWFGTEVLADLRQKGEELVSISQIHVSELKTQIEAEEVYVLDVRNLSEVALGAIPGSIHIPLGRLAGRVSEIPRDRPLVVNCAGGSRSIMAISVLLRHGLRDVRNLVGGYTAYKLAQVN